MLKLCYREAPIKGAFGVVSTRDQAIQASATRELEAAHIRNFKKLFHDGLTVAHPTTNEKIRPAAWSAVEQVDDEVLQLERYLNRSLPPSERESNYPNNVSVSYWIEPKSLGAIWRKYPKEGLVIELATLSRLERFAYAGYDEEKRHWFEAAQELGERHALTERWSARFGAPVAYLLGLASTTGWDGESIEYIQNFSGNTRILPYLIDLIDLKVYWPNTNDKSLDYLEHFDLPLGDRKIALLQQQLRQRLLVTNTLSLADLPAQLECSRALVLVACEQLVRSNPEYSLLEDGNKLIIYRGW